MKKPIAIISTLILTLGSLTACRDINASVDPSTSGTTNSLVSSSEVSTPAASSPTVPTSQSSSSSDASDSNDSGSSVSEPTEKVIGIYGETEIPDIPCGDVEFEGKASTIEDHDTLEKCLDSMVFETHIFGDYTVSLVGDGVRTDKTNFPGSIYAQNLRVEVKKNGEAINGDGNYNGTVLYESQFQREYKLLAGKIGNYLSVYELDTPVIAMRYFYDIEDRVVTKAVEFATIQNDELYDSFVGVCAKDTGIILNPDLDPNDPNTMLVLNSEDGARCRVSAFSANEFKIADRKTLFDEEAGIKYTFNFSDPPQMELYTVEKII